MYTSYSGKPATPLQKAIGYLLLAGIACFIYLHWTQLSTPAKSAWATEQGAYAIRITSRTRTSEPFDVEVDMASGNRWRVERKEHQSGAILVALCDGTNTVSNVPGISTVLMESSYHTQGILRATTINVSGSVALSGIKGTKRIDGHTCVQVGLGRRGQNYSAWVDFTTGFPVAILAFGSGHSLQLESHWSRLPVDFTQPDTEKFFDTAYTAPFFTSYLNP